MNPRGHTAIAKVAVLVTSFALAAGAFAPALATPAQGVVNDYRAGELRGTATFDGAPLRGATVVAYQVGARPSETRQLARDRTDARGAFRLRLKPRTEGQVYLVTEGGRRASREVSLALGLGEAWPRSVTVNELTTVATGFSLAQFTNDGIVAGRGVGLGNAMAMIRNIINPATGQPSRFIRSAPNGDRTATLGVLRTLGDAIASCRRSSDCRELLAETTTSRRGKPANTFQAMVNLARDPLRNTRSIHRLAVRGPWGRSLGAPQSWVIALAFQGNGREFRGPGNFLFDDDGNVWITNNYVPARDARLVCAGQALLKLEPYSAEQSVKQYTGGGVNGVGFGITKDAAGRIWVSNYGFKGTKCPLEPGSNTLSLFDITGTPLSPAGGYTQGGKARGPHNSRVREGDVMALSWPQGMAATADGAVWVANCGNDSVTRYPDGDPKRSENYSGGNRKALWRRR